MARVVVAEAANHDLARLVDFLLEADPAAAVQTNDVIFSALSMLSLHPLVGRPVEEGLRELVISRGRSGYLALYEYFEADDLVVVLAIRHQREGGYPGQE